MNLDPLRAVVSALDRAGCDPKSCGPDKYEARCPAHDGSRRNLSIAAGEKGVLLHCHHEPSCSFAAIVAALGLAEADLFHDAGAPAPRPAPATKIRKVHPDLAAAVRAAGYGLDYRACRSWTYDGPEGRPLLAVARYDLADGEKTYRALRPVEGGWQAGKPPGPAPLYRLPAIAASPSGDLIYLTEGEKCADALASYEPLVTASPFGAKAAGEADWSPLAGKTVVILPDADEPGDRYCAATLRHLARLAPRPHVKVVRLPDLADGEDVADWLPRVAGSLPEDAAVGRVRLELRALVSEAPWIDLDAPGEAVAIEAVDQPSSEGARVDDWPEPPGEEAFHGLAGEIVRMIEPHSEADPVGVLLQLIVAFGNITGTGLGVFADGHRHPAIEFAVTVGDTSRARKGTAWRRVREILSRADPDWAESRVIYGLSSGEGLIHEVRDPVEGEDEGSPPDKRRLVMEGEFGNVLRVIGREGNTLSGILRQAWDGDVISTLTRKNPLRATCAHISLAGHITQEELAQYLSKTEAFNGLGNRILWAVVRRSKLLLFGGTLPPEALTDLSIRLAFAARDARALGAMGWTEGARRAWERAYEALGEPRPGMWGAVTSRSEAHVLRLAMHYAALDRRAAIEEIHLRAALALWGFCDRSVRYLFGGALGNSDAEAILAALRASPGGLVRSEIGDLLGRHRSAEDLGRALAFLSRFGLASCETEKTGGRPATRWHARREDPARKARKAS